MHKDKKKNLCGRRTILIRFPSAIDRDRWMATIDYLKTRAIHNEYVRKYKLVNFLGHKDLHEENDGIEGDTKDNDMLYEFSEKFKQSTHASTIVNHVSQNGAMRRRSSGFPSLRGEKLPIKAADMTRQLKLLYSVGMTAYLHQVAQSSVKNGWKIQVSR